MATVSAPTSVFTYRSSRSAGFLIGILMAVAVETIAIHLLLHVKHPLLSWSVVVLSVVSGIWVAADYRARGTRTIKLDLQSLELNIGLRPAFRMALDAIDTVARPGWRDIPKQDPKYVNVTAPAQPNVMINMRTPVRVPIALGIKRSVLHIGLHVDEAEAFEAALRDAVTLSRGSK